MEHEKHNDYDYTYVLTEEELDQIIREYNEDIEAYGYYDPTKEH